MCSLLLLGVGISGYAMYWANGQLATRSQGIASLEAKVSETEGKIVNASSLKSELESNQSLREVAAGVLPDSKSQENIVGELISIADERGITLDGISFSGGNAGRVTSYDQTQTQKVDGIPGVLSIAIDTTVKSTYSNILSLLEDIENNRRRFEVVNINITPNSAEGVVLDYTAELDIITYIKP